VPGEDADIPLACHATMNGIFINENLNGSPGNSVAIA